MTSELRRVLDSIYALLLFRHIQSPVGGLASLWSEHELEKHGKVAWGGLTRS